MGAFARQELDAAGFPARTRELAYAVPVEQLAGDAAEIDLEVSVAGVDGQARMVVGYLPGGPITSGQQVISNGETRVLRKQLVKPGSVLVIALDQPGQVAVRVAGARGYDEDASTEGDGDVGEGEDTYGVDEDANDEGDGDAGDDEVVLGADDPFELVAKQTDAMNAAIKDLNELNTSYWLKVSATIDVGSGGSAKDAALGLQKTFTAAIAALDGPQRQRVMKADPAYPYSRWVQNATELRNSIAGAMGDTTQWGLLGMMASVGGDTAEQVAQLAKDAAPKVEQNFHWLIVGVVALAIVMVFK